MTKRKEDQGPVRDEKSQQQPKDRDRAQTAHKTEPGHMPPQPTTKRDDAPSVRRESGS
jgi:hypothetical protein